MPSYGPVGGGTVVTMDGVSMPEDLGVEVNPHHPKTLNPKP